jgi:DNA mismatch repair ATPase MutS
MSKIYKRYVNLKKEDENKFYLFNTGLFYTFIDEDAVKMSDLLELKLVNLNKDVKKCGFPVTTLLKYSNLLSQNKIEFEIIENDYKKIESNSKYIACVNNVEILNQLSDIDTDSISPREALNILNDLKVNLYMENNNE